MSQNIDMHILELLSSKVCHDLISPIGAINNGVELLEEMDPDNGDEIASLIAFSAAQASAKLQAFRMAYGAGGAGTGLKPEDVYNNFELLIEGDKKVTQDWDPHAPIGPEILPTGFCKILMACMLFALDCLPKGGTISITRDEDGQTLLKAEGEDASVKPNITESLALDIAPENLDPKTIHAYVTGLMAQSYSFKISTPEQGAGFVTLALTSPV